jgi:hypothetical protein
MILQPASAATGEARLIRDRRRRIGACKFARARYTWQDFPKVCVGASIAPRRPDRQTIPRGSCAIPESSAQWPDPIVDGVSRIMAELIRGPRALVAAVLIGCAAWGQIQAAEPVCSLDVDGDGEARALSDGLLVYRHLSGLTGSALTAGAVGAGCTRCTAAQITSFLAQSDCAGMLDVDGNGQRAAATDGVLFIRYLFGFGGEALITGAVARRRGRGVDPARCG